MTIDSSIFERNRASRLRMRELAAGLSDSELQTPVGEHWTVAIVYAHLAFWDQRVLYVLDHTEQAGGVLVPEIDISVNDLSLPLWVAIPPREAVRIALETADVLDARLEAFPPALLEAIYAVSKRWVIRALHRGEHLDEAEAALQSN